MKSSAKIVLSIIVIIAAGIAVGSILSPDTQMEKTDNALPKIVNVGALLPATGDLSNHGQDSILAVQLALVDFNKHLDSMDAQWNMDLIVEDTQTDPIVALEKIQSLNSKGIKLILGTQTSAELKSIKSYADSNNMLLISPSSTSPKLAIEDNIFRLIPDDTTQGKILSELFLYDNVKVIIPIYRGDVWGDGLYQSTRDSFELSEGVMDEGIRYSPEITVFSSEANLLSKTLTNYLDMGYSNEEIAILVIGFSEVTHLFNFVSSYDELHNVKWYGADGSSNDDTLAQDPIASKFATDVGFVTTQFSASTNSKFEHVRDHIHEKIGSAPNAYAYSAYDSLWLIGLSIIQTQSVDANIIGDVLPSVATQYEGAIGKIDFNKYGDLALSDYDLWTINNDEWLLYGHYFVADNSFEFYDTS